MILSRLTLDGSARARQWAANAYRIHQRLLMACDGDPRLLFRLEGESADQGDRRLRILVQSQVEPDWGSAFDNFPVLAGPAETRAFVVAPSMGVRYRFRLLANPTVCRSRPGQRNGQRIGLLHEDDQREWLTRKLASVGMESDDVTVQDLGLRRSQKGSGEAQTHLAVQFDGHGVCTDPMGLVEGVRAGIGPAKGYGFGLLSLARAG